MIGDEWAICSKRVLKIWYHYATMLMTTELKFSKLKFSHKEGIWFKQLWHGMQKKLSLSRFRARISYIFVLWRLLYIFHYIMLYVLHLGFQHSCFCSLSVPFRTICQNQIYHRYSDKTEYKATRGQSSLMMCRLFLKLSKIQLYQFKKLAPWIPLLTRFCRLSEKKNTTVILQTGSSVCHSSRHKIVQIWTRA